MSHQLQGGGRHCLAPGKNVGGDPEDETLMLRQPHRRTHMTLASVKDATVISSFLQLQD
jgi:hypothetical protein